MYGFFLHIKEVCVCDLMKIFSNAVTERINVLDRSMKSAVEHASAQIKSHVAT